MISRSCARFANQPGGHINSQIPWLRIGAESVLIVASILLAFGIDAWWDGRSTAHERSRYLAALVDDFTVNAERLDSLEAIHAQTLDVALTLLAMSGPDAQVSDTSGVATLLRGVMRQPTYAPVTGTIDALVQAGYLNRIGNDSLEAELASWDEELRDYAEDEAWGAEDVRVRLVPFLSERVPLLMGFASNDPFAADYVGLLRNVEFANYLTVRAHRTGVILNQVEPLRAKIERIVRLARSELSG